MGKGTKISKKPASTAAATAPATKSRAGASDALRQAIKDLGGDDSDLDLIAGIDSDDEEAAPPPSKGKGKDDEVCLRHVSYGWYMANGRNRSRMPLASS
jgi:ribosome biogenesis protein MAK21